MNDQDHDSNDNKLTFIDSIRIDKIRILDGEAANKKYVDDTLGEGSILRYIKRYKII